MIFLSVREAEFTNKVLDELRAVAWARPLLDRLEMSGGLTASNMPLLFEARVAYELHRAERTAEYEFPTGVGESSVDFRVMDPRNG